MCVVGIGYCVVGVVVPVGVCVGCVVLVCCCVPSVVLVIGVVCWCCGYHGCYCY